MGLQQLEDAGKPVGKIYKHILALKEFSQSIFQVRTALYYFTLNAPYQL